MYLRQNFIYIHYVWIQFILDREDKLEERTKEWDVRDGG